MAAGPIPHNLPESASHFAYFRREREELLARLLPDKRDWLLPITGLGASSKTALTLEVAHYAVANHALYRFGAVVWCAARCTALYPVGPRLTGLRCPARPLTLATISHSVGEVVGCPELAAAAEAGDVAYQIMMLPQLLHRHATLLVLDELDYISAVDEPLILSLLEHLPAPCKALATMRRNILHERPIRPWVLSDAEMDAFLTQHCLAFGIMLAAEDLLRIRRWAMGLPFAARVAVCRIKELGIDGARRYFERGPAPLVRPVLGRQVAQLRVHRPDVYGALRTLASLPGIERGLTETEVLDAFEMSPDECLKMVAHLLRANLLARIDVTPRGSTSYRPANMRYLMPPLLRWYLRRPKW